MAFDQGPPDPEELDAAAGSAHGAISAQTVPGEVWLTVSDLQQSASYYQRAVGLKVLSLRDGVARLGVDGTPLLVLVEETGASPATGYTGLYHFALLVSRRVDLARWLEHAAKDRVPLVGLSDHFVSEALYLSDPDGHGIEIYWDRPRSLWEGQVAARMTTLPLDVDDLLGELDEPGPEVYPGLPDDTVMGHVHLRVSAIPETIAFYRDLIGFALTAQLGEQAAFLSAGGYHHHIGANTWESAGRSSPPPGTAGLRHATIVLPSESARDLVLKRLSERGHEALEDAEGPLIRDPSGNALMLALPQARAAS
jgi:catechol 2,3-dioxygenase